MREKKIEINREGWERETGRQRGNSEKEGGGGSRRRAGRPPRGKEKE